MHTITSTTWQLFSCVCYVFLISGGRGHTAWGELDTYLPSNSQEDKTPEFDESVPDKRYSGSSDILNSLSKLYMLAISKQHERPNEPISRLLLPVYGYGQETTDLVNETTGDVSLDDSKEKDKKADPSLAFVGSRGKRQPASLGFIGSRGKKQSQSLNFIPSRGRKQLSTAFVGSRGRRISAEAFSPSRGRRLSSQAFYGSRGKRFSALGFMGSRGKKDSEIENLLLKNENAGWTQDNYNRRAAPFFHGFVASRGKRSSEMS